MSTTTKRPAAFDIRPAPVDSRFVVHSALRPLPYLAIVCAITAGACIAYFSKEEARAASDYSKHSSQLQQTQAVNIGLASERKALLARKDSAAAKAAWASCVVPSSHFMHQILVADEFGSFASGNDVDNKAYGAAFMLTRIESLEMSFVPNSIQFSMSLSGTSGAVNEYQDSKGKTVSGAVIGREMFSRLADFAGTLGYTISDSGGLGAATSKAGGWNCQATFRRRTPDGATTEQQWYSSPSLTR